MFHGFEFGGETHDVQLSRSATGYRLHLGAHTLNVTLTPLYGGESELTVDELSVPVLVATHGDDVFIHLDGQTHHLRYRHPLTRLAARSDVAAADHVRALMPGSIVSVAVAQGDQVLRGQTLLVMESMKMETTILAPRNGVIKTVHCDVAQTFAQDAVLVSLEPIT